MIVYCCLFDLKLLSTGSTELKFKGCNFYIPGSSSSHTNIITPAFCP